MIQIYLLVLLSLLFNGCVNKHGISAKYYSDCKEYYDLQGYYHKKCSDGDIVTYETMSKKVKGLLIKKEETKQNVW